MLLLMGRKMTLPSLAFLPQYLLLRTISSFSPTVHDLNLNGPVPVGCSKPYVPVGREDAVPDLGLVGAVFLQRVRARDPEVRERKRRDERPERLRQRELHAVGALRLAALVQAGREVRALVLLEAKEDRLPVVGGVRRLERSLEVVPAVEVVTDRRRVERRPVVELDTVPEGEGPYLPAARGLPAQCEPGADLGRPGFEADEALEDLVDHTQRLAVGHERPVQHHRIRGRPEHQSLRRATALRCLVRPAARTHHHQRDETHADEECERARFSPHVNAPFRVTALPVT